MCGTSTEKSTNIAKEANLSTMSFLDTTAELQLTNTTIRQLSHHAFGILVDNDLAACRLSPIINQEFTPCSRPENERVHEQHGLGLPVRSAHDPSGARPLDTVDPGGELEYYTLHIRNFAHYLSRSNRGIEDTDFPRPSKVEVLQFKGFHTSLVATPYDPYCCSC
jgi:hypothetical protein